MGREKNFFGFYADLNLLWHHVVSFAAQLILWKWKRSTNINWSQGVPKNYVSQFTSLINFSTLQYSTWTLTAISLKQDQKLLWIIKLYRICKRIGGKKRRKKGRRSINENEIYFEVHEIHWDYFRLHQKFFWYEYYFISFFFMENWNLSIGSITSKIGQI